jgi:hypothetical protein
MRKTITVLVAVVASTVLATSVALADTDVDADGGVYIEGTGKLVAAGVGSAYVQGDGFVKLRIRGDVTITDYVGDARIVIRHFGEDAHSPASADTTITLTGFRGVVKVWGSDFSVDAEGRIRRLVARGTGSAFLQGRGWYRTSGGQFGYWTPEGINLSFEPDAA